MLSLSRNRHHARRRHLGWRRNRTSGRVSRPRSVTCSAELTTRAEKRKKRAKQPNQVPFRGRRLSCVPGSSFRPGATQTNAGATTERRCCLGSVVSVISPPESTSRAESLTSAKKSNEALRRQRRRRAGLRRLSPSRRDETDARASSQRSRRCCGVAIVIPPVALTTHGGRTRCGPRICAKRHFGVVA